MEEQSDHEEARSVEKVTPGSPLASCLKKRGLDVEVEGGNDLEMSNIDEVSAQMVFQI